MDPRNVKIENLYYEEQDDDDVRPDSTCMYVSTVDENMQSHCEFGNSSLVYGNYQPNECSQVQEMMQYFQWDNRDQLEIPSHNSAPHPMYAISFEDSDQSQHLGIADDGIEYVMAVDQESFPTMNDDEFRELLDSKQFQFVIPEFPESYVIDPSVPLLSNGSGTWTLENGEFMINSPTTFDVPNPDEYVYVNAKQFHRIMVRREARRKLESRGLILPRREYLHASRHKIAKTRERGPGGRFGGKKISTQ
ncbi:hypothetical protein PFISCL1PPCAC_1749 [Pristionchus fissidentatus]|uniref:Nuclear transcription factor Y subunit n=1 Tax=Pristionchus fissidentatus TaxID=1538716 RepID=A0AAV5UVZ9_9BILA|nr:hypothetical protein PFISCL1PPCAC_1749 [Pristionchus fissidentatus]